MDNLVVEDLLLKTAKGDMEAFEKLYMDTKKFVYSHILSVIKDPEIAQDLTQDTFIKIKDSAHTYKPQGTPMAWILRIGKNFALMAIRKSGREQITDIEENEYLVNRSAEMSVDETIVLKAAMDTLNEEEREIVFLHIVNGMKHKEIAKIVGKPLGTVLWKYNAALGKLKKVLKSR